MQLTAVRIGPLAGVLLAIVLGGPLSSPAWGESLWTTYHRDARRSGYDPDATKPVSPSQVWHTEDLGAPIWSQPLVLGEQVYVATVGDMAYALEASSGDVVWKKSLGTPVPEKELPCGDIEPTVGVVGTPLIDPATKAIYMVADTWDAGTKEAHHILKGLSLANGEEVLSTPVDPPGADPKALLQRTALNLDKGDLIFGYGGNDGDCSDYQGAVVAVPENGEPARFWQYQPAPPSSSGGAVWAPAGPSVDEAGNVFATTGNPDPPNGQTASIFDFSDAVVELNPQQDFVEHPASETASPLGWFEPPNWEEESNNDLDLSSAAAELLPGELLFQAGKDGKGYLIAQANMNTGASAVFSAEVCKGSGSFGGDAFFDGVIYIPCTNGTQALAYDEQACTFTPLWQGPSDAFGPPIVSGGLVWTIATGKFAGGGTKLYGLEPSSGSARYTETLPSPVADHFASPSAAGGRLFVATGSTVTAYQIAQLSSGEPTVPETPSVAGCLSSEPPSKSSTENPPANSTTNGPAATGASPNGGAQGSGSSSRTSAVKGPLLPLAATELVDTKLHVHPDGRVRLALRCRASSGSCRGTVTLKEKVTVSGTQRVMLVELTHARYGPVHGAFHLSVRLDAGDEARLRRHGGRLSIEVLISAPGSRTRSASAVLGKLSK